MITNPVIGQLPNRWRLRLRLSLEAGGHACTLINMLTSAACYGTITNNNQMYQILFESLLTRCGHYVQVHWFTVCIHVIYGHGRICLRGHVM